MPLPPFKLEDFWKKYEFNAPHLLCPSDAESWSFKELMALADDHGKQLWEQLWLGYTDVQGLLALRQEIAKLYASIDSDHILTLAGGEEGIYCALRTLLSPGDHVIAFTPGYQSLETLSRAIGADVTLLELKPQKQWQLSLEDIARAFRPNTKLVLLTNPHNPTGTVLSKETLAGIVDLARQRQSYIFCDEIYRFLELDEEQRPPSIADHYELGIALSGMAKPFGMSGLRIGWLATQDKSLLEKIAAYKVYTSICNSAPSEVLAFIALRAKEFILQRNMQIIQHNLRLLDAFFTRQKAKLRWIRPQSGTVAFVELLLPIDVDAFADRLLKETGILIMPGTIFDYPGNYFRIGFGRKNMPDVLLLFEKYFNKQG